MKKKIAILVLIFTIVSILVLPNLKNAQAAVALRDIMDAKIYSNSEISETKTLPYRIYVPESYTDEKEYKLLIMFHGDGEKGNDNLAPINFSTGMVYAQNIINNAKYKEEFIILVPQCPKDDYWVDWTKGSYVDIDNRPQTISSQLASGLLFDTVQEYNVDMASLYITGLSMGGYATWDFVCRYPGLFAAALPMCGGCDPSYYKEASLTPIWSFHCDNDPVVNYNANKEMVNKLKSIGAGIYYTEYSGIYHDSWIPGYQNENAFNWMITQKRKNVYYTVTSRQETATVKNISTKGEPIISYIDPTYGIGSKNPSTICDGRAEFNQSEFEANKDSFAHLQCDTYGLNKPNDVYFGYTFKEEYEISRVWYQAGRYFPNSGGWFANGVKVQALVNNEWVDVELTNNPNYPVVAEGKMIDLNQHKDFESYEFEFAPINTKGIRLISRAGGPQYFASCAELEVYGKKEQIIDTTVDIVVTTPSDVYTDEYIIDKIKGAQIGQMVGVVWGASTEFAYKEGLIPDNKIPSLAGLNYNDAFAQDDLYVEIPFIDALLTEGIDVSIETMGEYFGETTFPLWHGNDVARTNINRGIKAPLSGSYLYNSCCEDIDWQIESDFVGIMTPGMSNLAAQLGFDYGHVIGYADGVYGGSYVSAMHSKAYIAENIPSIIVTGIESIPQGSKFRELLDDIFYWYLNDVNFEDCFDKLNEKWVDDDRCPREGFGGRAPFNIDAKLNAGYCLLGLLYGENDFVESMRVSMKCGQDSDCNPSTVGSILGNFYGYDQLDGQFKSGVNFNTYKFSYTDYTLQDTVDALFELGVLYAQANGREVSDGTWTLSNDEEIVPVPLEVWEEMPGIEYTILQTSKTIKVTSDPYYNKGIKEISWDFGDGTVVKQANAEHTYAKVGDYTLTLKVVGNDDTVATRVLDLNIFIDDNIAGTGTAIVSQKNPGGAGSRDLNVIIDGSVGTSSSQQYDTYYSELAPAHEDYFGVTFDEVKNLYKLTFFAGCYFNNGGWFEDIRVQALIDGTWTDITLTNDPNYPCAKNMFDAGKEYSSYDFEFEEIACIGIRIIGQAGGSAHFASCSELRVYESSTPDFIEEEYSFTKLDEYLVVTFDNLVENVSKVYLNSSELEPSKYVIDAETIVFDKAVLNELFGITNTLKIVFEDNKEISCTIIFDNPCVGFEANDSAVNKSYLTGEQLDLSKLVVTAKYADGSSKLLTSDDFTVSTQFDSSVAGIYAVSITYKDFDTYTFNVEVYSEYVTGIEISVKPKTTFTVGEEIKFDGMVVCAIYSTGKKVIIKDYELDASAVENGKGTYTVIVKYETFMSYFNITFVEPVVNGNQNSDVNTKGCGGSIGMSVISILAVAGLLYVLKKKKKLI